MAIAAQQDYISVLCSIYEIEEWIEMTSHQLHGTYLICGNSTVRKYSISMSITNLAQIAKKLGNIEMFQVWNRGNLLMEGQFTES